MMSTLPKHIILIVCKDSSKANKDILKIFKDYFSGIPHIPYTNPTLCNSDTYYIVPYNKLFREILGNITFCGDLYTIFGFATYERQTSSPAPTFTKNIIREFYNFRYLPLNITIDPKYLEKLKSIIEDYYD